MSRFTIEGLVEHGQWLRSQVGADSANMFETREAAEFELAQLAQIFECPAGELRVVELPEVDE